MPEEQILQVYKAVVIIVALYVGIFGVFFTNKFIELNRRRFEKNGMKSHANQFNKPYMYWLVKLLGTLFLLIGFSMLVGHPYFLQKF